MQPVPESESEQNRESCEKLRKEMEAKDVKWCPQHGYPLPCDKCGMSLTKTWQDTGIQEAKEQEEA